MNIASTVQLLLNSIYQLIQNHFLCLCFQEVPMLHHPIWLVRLSSAGSISRYCSISSSNREFAVASISYKCSNNLPDKISSLYRTCLCHFFLWHILFFSIFPYDLSDYSCAVTPCIRQTGTAYASLLA